MADAVSWFLVGSYYLSADRSDAAADAFEKATNLNPSLAPAWIGLGHAAADHEESDRAMAAYRTASRLFPGWHLPHLCLALESQRMHNPELAKMFLEQARVLCPTDPALYNELGVLRYKRGAYREALALFEFVMNLISHTPLHLRFPWVAAYVNAGHCLRRLGQWDDAIAMVEMALAVARRGRDGGGSLPPTSLIGVGMAAEDPTALGLRGPAGADGSTRSNRLVGTILTILAFTRHMAGQIDEAIATYHAVRSQEMEKGE